MRPKHIKSLQHDLLSGKALNKAVNRIVLEKDPEESGVFVVFNSKISKPKSFAFMEGQRAYKSFECLLSQKLEKEQMPCQRFRKDVWLRIMARGRGPSQSLPGLPY